MQDFFDVTEEDLVDEEKLIFKDQEIVKMQCVDFHQNNQNGSLILKCMVLSGTHLNKKTTIFLNSKDNPTSKKMKAQFIKAFYTAQEIVSKACPPARIIMRMFSVRSTVKTDDKTGKIYQNWQDFQDIGAGPTVATAGQPATTVSPAAAPPSAQPSNGMPSF